MWVCSYLVNSGVGSATVPKTFSSLPSFFMIIFNCFAPEFFEFPMKLSEKSVIAVKLK